MRKRRYEILLPVRDNDGRLVSWEAFAETWEELITRFGGVTGGPEGFRGGWIHEGVRFEEDMRRLTVDVDNTASNKKFFARFKTILRRRFKQLEVYIASYLIDIV